MIGQYLKRADQFIKAGNFDSADREVGFALKEEPTNIYALAYRERIHRARIEHENEVREAEERRVKDEIYRKHEKEMLQEKLRKQREEREKIEAAAAAAGYGATPPPSQPPQPGQPPASVPASPPLPHAGPAPPGYAPNPYLPPEYYQYPPGAVPPQPGALPPGQMSGFPPGYPQGFPPGYPSQYPPGYPSQAYPPQYPPPQGGYPSQYPPQPPTGYPVGVPAQYPAGIPPAGPGFYPNDRQAPFSGGRLELRELSPHQQYKDMLMRAWRNGVPSAEDFDLLERARLELNVSPEDASLLYMEVKAESYINAIKIAWRQRRIDPSQPSAFEEFRVRFAVTPDEHLQWEARILWELQLQQKHETVMYIDDDIGLTEVIGETLEDAGYKTIISTSPEEALAKLKNIIPDLILCDVRFPDSPLNGLAIYEEVRKMPHFNTVPFLFLSAVTDDHIMHAGLGSGADDYITKPFNPDTLLAIIEGKLKRYKQLRQTRGV